MSDLILILYFLTRF